jgi:tetratricopeptide (TPR) repeat protein
MRQKKSRARIVVALYAFVVNCFSHPRRVYALCMILLVWIVPPAVSMWAQVPATNAAELLQAGKLVEARNAYEAILNDDPANQPAQQGEVAASERIALEARDGGRADDALRALMRAETFVPASQRLLFDLGVIEEQMRLYRDADDTLTALEKLEQQDPAHSQGAQVLYAVARVKMDLGQLDVAEAKLSAYLATHPQDASAHYGMGRVYQQGQSFDKAKVEFKRSIELQPVQTEGYYQLGDIALSQNSFDEAIAEFAKTIARNPKHGGALAGTGQAYFKQKQYKQAQEYLERAVEAAPGYQAGHYYLGLTLARLGKKEDSQRELDLATRLAEMERQQGGGLHLNP